MNQKNYTTVQGIARNVTWRERYGGYQILSFTVEVTDKQGDIQQYVPVYVESLKIEGVLPEGYDVRVIGEIDENGTLKPEEIVNIKTEAKIAFRITSGWDWSDPLVWLQATIIFVAFATVFILGLWFIQQTGFLGAIIILVVLSAIYFAYSKERRNRE